MPVVLRAVVVYLWAIVLLRLMGKSLTFQQKPYDFVVMMLIGSASAALIVNVQVPLLNALIALATLAAMHSLISVLSLSNMAKGFIGGKPDIVVRNGRIAKANLIKNQINLEQLLSALRIKGYRQISDIEFAILEPNGQLSVVPKSQTRPVTPQDLQIATMYEGISTPLVVEGKVISENLTAVGLDQDWLIGELTKRGVGDPQRVLLASLNSDGSLYIAEQPPLSPFRAFFVGEGKDGPQGRTTNKDVREE